MPTLTLLGNPYPVYDTLANVNAFLAFDIARGDAWTALAATPTRQQAAMITATRLFARLPWCVTPPPVDDAPEPVRQAFAMTVADIAAKPALGDGAPSGSNIQSAKAGSASVTYFAPTSGAPPIGPGPWGVLTAAGLIGCKPEFSPDEAPYVGGSDDCRPVGGFYTAEWDGDWARDYAYRIR